ncbi:hypothetical protein BJV82DRAFT_158114 [Fennellomyces sp. T-0311]|nr:hypothetical protein BJV82DRAFT_158114 [Fennellomyces sp. T-0311]
MDRVYQVIESAILRAEQAERAASSLARRNDKLTDSSTDNSTGYGSSQVSSSVELPPSSTTRAMELRLGKALNVVSNKNYLNRKSLTADTLWHDNMGEKRSAEDANGAIFAKRVCRQASNELPSNELPINELSSDELPGDELPNDALPGGELSSNDEEPEDYVSSDSETPQKKQWYCPYQNCVRDYSTRCTFFRHVRSIHYSDFPKFSHIIDKNYTFKTPGGDLLDFSNAGNCRMMLQHGDPIIVEKANNDEECDQYFSAINGLERHIRNFHYPDFDNSGKYLKAYKTPKGDMINLKSENCRNMLAYGDPIHVERVKPRYRFYCPYQGCVRSFPTFYTLSGHFRCDHHIDYPKCGDRFGDRISKTPNGDILDFSDEGCRNTLAPGDPITVEIIESFYCPYQECNHIASNSCELTSHIKNIHYPECPILNMSLQIFKNSEGKVLRFNNEGCRNMLKMDEVILAECIVKKER